MLKKKSQLSIFIIIGVIALIISIFLIIILKGNFSNDIRDETNSLIAGTVKDCIYNTGRNGVSLLKLKGGFLEVPERIIRNPYATVDLGFKVPIWEDNLFPTISSMEYDLKRYVEENSMSCIKEGLNQIDKILDYNFKGNLSVEPSINEESVTFNIKLPIEYKRKGIEESIFMDNFFVELKDERLKKMYEIALSIINKENQENYLENLVLEQLYNANNYWEPKYSVPTEGMYFNCAKRVWTYPQLMSTIVSLNNNNFKYLYYIGTKKTEHNSEGYKKYKDYYDRLYNIRLDNLPEKSNEFYTQTFVPSSRVFKNNDFVDNFFTFKKFEVIPNDDGIVTSIDLDFSENFDLPNGIPQLHIPCIQLFHHLYNLDYAVVTKIIDSSNGEFFQFPIRIKINRNIPNGNPINIITNEPLELREHRFCSEDPDVVEYNVTIDNINYNKEVENKPYRRYPLMIQVRDKSTGEYLEDVKIEERCVNFKCDIGNTSHPVFAGIVREGATPRLLANFSYCINGEIIAKKDGYYRAIERLDIDESLLERTSPLIITLEMEKLRKLKIGKTSSLKNYLSRTNPRGIIANNKDFIFVTVKANEIDYVDSGFYSTDMDEEVVNDFGTLELFENGDYSYNLTAYYMDKDYNLLGIKILNDWKPGNVKGDEIILTIPGYPTPVDSNNYVQFFEYVREYSDDDMPIISS